MAVEPITANPEDQPSAPAIIIKKNGNGFTPNNLVKVAGWLVVAVTLAVGIMIWLSSEQNAQDDKIVNNEKSIIKIDVKMEGVKDDISDMKEDINGMKGDISFISTMQTTQGRKLDAIMYKLDIEEIPE